MTGPHAAGLARLAHAQVVLHNQNIALIMDKLDELIPFLRGASEALNTAKNLLGESSRMLVDSDDAEGIVVGIHAGSLDTEVHALIRMFALCKGKSGEIGTTGQTLLAAVQAYATRLGG